MQLEAGKYYRTRDGRKAFVVGRNPFPSDCPWLGATESADDLSWTDDGCFDVAPGDDLSRGSLFDLIAPWADPPATKWRPYTGDELPPCGTVTVRKSDGAEFMIVARNKVGSQLQVMSGWGWIHATALLDNYTHADGSPCGIEVLA